MSTSEPRYPAGLSEIADDYDGFLVDLWGCVHDGVRPFPRAVEALGELARRGKRVCLLSNGPRRVSALCRRLDEMGVDRGLYTGVMSSGEAAWRALAERPDAFHRSLGTRCYHMGPERDASVCEGNGLDVVERVEDAEFLLCTGIYEPDETVEDHEPVLSAALARDLAMVCANPDLVVHVGEKLSICAGTLAQHYAGRGGRVAWHGKPHASVYERCYEILGDVPRGRILCIGDGLMTDIGGAVAQGLDSVFLTTGIFADEVGGESPRPDAVLAAARREGAIPTYALPGLVW